MARSYGKVLASVWQDPEWVALDDDVQQMYVLLLSQPKLSLAGVVELRPRRWAAYAANTTEETIQRKLDALVSRGFVLVDYTTEEVLIRTFVKHDLNESSVNSNLLKGLWGAWRQVESQPLKAEILRQMPLWVWMHPKCEPDPAAVSMRSRLSTSARLEPMVGTDGSDRWMEPPLAFSLQPEALTLDPSAAGHPQGSAGDAGDKRSEGEGGKRRPYGVVSTLDHARRTQAGGAA